MRVYRGARAETPPAVRCRLEAPEVDDEPGGVMYRDEKISENLAAALALLAAHSFIFIISEIRGG